MSFRINPQLMQKMNDEEKKVVGDVTRKYTLFVTAPLALGCMFGINQLIKIELFYIHRSHFFKVQTIEVWIWGFMCLNFGTLLTEREIDRRLMAEVPNGLYSTLKKLTDEEKMQYIAVMRQKGFVYPHEVFPEKFADSQNVDQQTTAARPGSDVRVPPSSGNVSSSPYGGMPGLGAHVDTDTDIKETNKPAFSYRIARQKFQSSDSEDSDSISTSSEPSFDETKPSPSQPPSKLRLRKNKYGDEMD